MAKVLFGNHSAVRVRRAERERIRRLYRDVLGFQQTERTHIRFTDPIIEPIGTRALGGRRISGAVKSVSERADVPACLTALRCGAYWTTRPQNPFTVTESAAQEFCSGGDPELGASKDLFVDGPNGVHAVFKSDGKVPLLLFPAGTEDICDGSPVAEGTGIYTDNSSNLIGGHGRGTAGFQIRGEVTDQAGERHHVLVVVQQQLGPGGFQDLVVKIAVNRGASFAPGRTS